MSYSERKKQKCGFVYLVHCEIKNPDMEGLTTLKYGCTSLPVKQRMIRLKYEKKSTHVIKDVLCYAHVPNRYAMENEIKWSIQPSGMASLDETFILDSGSGESIDSVVSKFSYLVFNKFGVETTIANRS